MTRFSSSDSTLTRVDESHTETSQTESDCLALVVLWALEEPDQAGQVFLIPSPGEGTKFVMGRRPPGAGDEYPRLQLVRQRPGANHRLGVPSCLHLSRTQLEISHLPQGGLQIENVGKLAPLRVNGVPVSSSRVLPGDVLELNQTLLLLCTKRPKVMPPMVGKFPFHPYGAADHFDLVGESAVMWQLRREILTAARRMTHVIAFGPSGSGKESVIRALALECGHTNFVAVSAPDIAGSLFESELFGNIADYPQRGMVARPGLIGEADGTTLILDEIGDLAKDLQARLLRVMATGEYRRLGDARFLKARLRFVACTNQDESALRPEFLARFQDRIYVPDLNARRDDIPLLTRFLLHKNTANGRLRDFSADHFPKVSLPLMAHLVTHTYRGNVRELETLLLQAADKCSGPELLPRPEWVQAVSKPIPFHSPLTVDADAPTEIRRLPARERSGLIENDALEIERVESRTSPIPFDNLEIEDAALERGVLENATLEIPRPVFPAQAAKGWSVPRGEGNSMLERPAAYLFGLVRQHRFNGTALAADPAYFGGGVAAANRQLCLLFCRALHESNWSVDRAALQLAGGPDRELFQAARLRLVSFLRHMIHRVKTESSDDLHRALRRAYRRNYPLIASLVQAIQSGQVQIDASPALARRTQSPEPPSSSRSS